MSKLFAPILDSKLPAIAPDNFTIPFRFPLGVGSSQISGIRAKIKLVSSGEYIKNGNNDYWDGTINKDMTVSFNITELSINNYYKIQIAFIEKETFDIGYYSNMGVFKYVSSNLSMGIIWENDNLSYKLSGSDLNLIMKYQFLVSKDNKIIYNTGWQVDTSKEWIIDYFEDCFKDHSYSIKCNYLTIDNYSGTISTSSRSIKFITDSTNDNSYIYDPEKGSFIFNRSINIDTNLYKIIDDNHLSIIKPTKLLTQDYFIEQGKKYQYGTWSENKIQIFNNLDSIQTDFEDIFIYDGEKQLRLAYNPKVSSYKTNLLETKTNTIGGKYPFIFRNGDVNYKEFQISGLLSANLDQDNQFINEELIEEPTREKIAATGLPDDWVSSHTDLTADNIYRERQFKTNVYNWLTNGEVKLLRTPTEGNFLVRFINVSMTPNDQLSRMLHTVNMTAVEIDECTNENMRKYGLM